MTCIYLGLPFTTPKLKRVPVKLVSMGRGCLYCVWESCIGSWYEVEWRGRTRPRFFLWGQYQLSQPCAIAQDCFGCHSRPSCRRDFTNTLMREELARLRVELDVAKWKTLPPLDVVRSLPETRLTERMALQHQYRAIPPRVVVTHIFSYLTFRLIGPRARNIVILRRRHHASFVNFRNPVDLWGRFRRDITRTLFCLAACLEIGYLDFDNFEIPIEKYLPYISRLTHLDLSCSYSVAKQTIQQCPKTRRLNIRTNVIALDDIADFASVIEVGRFDMLEIHLRFSVGILLVAMTQLAECCRDSLTLHIGSYGIDLSWRLFFRKGRTVKMEIGAKTQRDAEFYLRRFPNVHPAYRPSFRTLFDRIGCPETVVYINGWPPSYEERAACRELGIRVIEISNTLN